MTAAKVTTATPKPRMAATTAITKKTTPHTSISSSFSYATACDPPMCGFAHKIKRKINDLYVLRDGSGLPGEPAGRLGVPDRAICTGRSAIFDTLRAGPARAAGRHSAHLAETGIEPVSIG